MTFTALPTRATADLKSIHSNAGRCCRDRCDGAESTFRAKKEQQRGAVRLQEDRDLRMLPRVAESRRWVEKVKKSASV